MLGGHYYYTQALQACKSFYNSTIATPRTSQELACIQESGAAYGYPVWIGVSQSGGAANPYLYETDGAPVTSAKWDVGYPKYPSQNMNCVHLHPTQLGSLTSELYWRDDASCDSYNLQPLCQFG